MRYDKVESRRKQLVSKDNRVSTIITSAFCQRNNRDRAARLKIKSSATCRFTVDCARFFLFFLFFLSNHCPFQLFLSCNRVVHSATGSASLNLAIDFSRTKRNGEINLSYRPIFKLDFLGIVFDEKCYSFSFPSPDCRTFYILIKLVK